MTSSTHPASLRSDLAAGLVVFLVALPLCLGIALASGAPLVGGLVAGVVGGLAVGLLSGSEISVSGPAAGLAVIVATGIHDLGSYETFLAAVVLSGVFQLAFAAARLGVLADFVPTTVIKGMLAAIGIVIVLKQLPHAFGRDADFEGNLSFLEPGGHENTLSAIVKALASASPGAVIISAVSIGILLGWDKFVVPRIPRLKILPAPLLVVVLGVVVNELLAAVAPDLALRASDGHLVSLPTSVTDLRATIASPSLSAFLQPAVWLMAATIAIVGSLESLLSLEAAQKLDPLRRFASPTRELFAQGVGNVLSGLFGGLPVTSVVVRTSANVYAGGRHRAAAIFHAVFLALAVLLIPTLLVRLPLACLASILFLVGLKLAPPSLFRSMWSEGWASFVPFIVTILGVIFSNLLEGVLFGLAVGVGFVIRANHHAAMNLVSDENHHLLRFNKDLTFVNKTELKASLARVPENGRLVVDATRSLYLDRDVFDVLDDYIESARSKSITVELKNFHGKRPQERR